MTKLIILTATMGLLLLSVPQVKAQHYAVKEFHGEYKNYHDVHHIHLEGGIFKLITWITSLNSNDEEAKAISRLTNNLHGLDIVVVPKHHKPEKDLVRLKKDLKSDNFDELMNVREDGKLINFYAQDDKNEVRDMIIFIDEENEYVILSVKGTLDLEDMKYLAKHHNQLGN